MRSLLAFAAAAAFVAPLAASAADAPAPTKVLRHLVYDVTYSARTTHEVKTSGFNGGFGAGTIGDGKPASPRAAAARAST